MRSVIRVTHWLAGRWDCRRNTGCAVLNLRHGRAAEENEPGHARDRFEYHLIDSVLSAHQTTGQEHAPFHMRSCIAIFRTEFAML
jgi:hypothetical protein